MLLGLTQFQAHQPLAGHRMKPACAADAKIDFPWTPHNPWLALLSKGRRCALIIPRVRQTKCSPAKSTSVCCKRFRASMGVWRSLRLRLGWAKAKVRDHWPASSQDCTALNPKRGEHHPGLCLGPWPTTCREEQLREALHDLCRDNRQAYWPRHSRPTTLRGPQAACTFA